MILDDFPSAKSMSPENQLEMAAELIELATDRSSNRPDSEIVAALNVRLEEYQENPEKVSKLKDIRGRVSSGA